MKIKLPNNFLDLSKLKQEQILSEKYSEINKLHDKVFSLLAILRGGRRINESDFKKQ